MEVAFNKAAVGKAFKKEAKGVTDAIQNMSDEEKLAMKEQLTSDNFKVNILLNLQNKRTQPVINSLKIDS